MSRLRFPHPLVLLSGCIAVAALLTWLLPAGQYDRRHDPAADREVVLPGTYHSVESRPIGPLEALSSVPRGIIDAADVIALVFLVGGAFVVVDRTGALRTGLDGLARRLQTRSALVIPVIAAFFAVGGITENMQEEIIALVPVLLLLARRTGFDAITAVAMSAGAAMVGSAFSPMNPFQVLIAQRISQVPLYSGWEFRTVFLVLALALWVGGTMRYALRIRGSVDAASTATPPAESPDVPAPPPLGTARSALVLGTVLIAFATFIYGLARLGWGFIEMAGVFLAAGIIAGIVGRLGLNGTATAFVDGFRDMALSALLIGFARAIYVVLNDGLVVDTIVHGVFQPLEALPRTAAAAGMIPVHALIHVPVPSVSGQAVLTMPILTPLGDLLGISRQVIILAHQVGAGLCDLLTPTNGALMAVLAAADVTWPRWLRFALPLWAALMALGLVATFVGILIGLG